jgi:hypothetical protein
VRGVSLNIVCKLLMGILFRRKNAPAKLEEEAKSSAPKVDYSLKEGQTFKITIPGGKPGASTSTSGTSSSTSSSTTTAIPLLPPPPGARKR